MSSLEPHLSVPDDVPLQRIEDAKLFPQRKSNSEDSPTTEPLVINKSRPTNPPRAGSAASGRYHSSKQIFPLPPGVSNFAVTFSHSGNEGQSFQYPRPAEPRPHHAPYQDDSHNAIPNSVSQKSSPYSSPSPPPGTSSRYQGRPAPRSKNLSHGASSKLGSSPEEKSGPRLVERRGAALKPLSEPPGRDTSDREGLFALEPREKKKTSNARCSSQSVADSEPDSDRQCRNNRIGTVNTGPIASEPLNRFSSTGSTSTTRASRGSPVPPETPILGPGDQPSGGIEARYASAGIAGPATLSSLQAQNAAAALRSNQYAPPPLPRIPMSPGSPPGQQVPRPWTPTESPEDQPHGPPTVYQGPNQVPGSGSSLPPSQHVQQDSVGFQGPQPRALEQDFQRMRLSASPPPAYSSITPKAGPSSGACSAAQGYPNEKQTTAARTDFAAPLLSPALQHPGHPAFANDPMPLITTSPQGQEVPVQQSANTSLTQGEDLASPPPLPEGWIAHLDQTSGQYYYIHLPTQATQWEFPKGPTPLNLDVPLLPPSTYGNPLASPAYSTFSRQSTIVSPGYAESVMSKTSQTLSVASFSGPPSAGVDMYKVAPTNAVYFGPYLKYINMDLERGLWLGSIMLVTDAPQPPTIHIHRSLDLSPNPRQLEANPISTHRRWVFYRYDVDLQMSEGAGDKWTYAITSHLGCTRYEFLVAGRYETNWRFIAHSGNDFAMSTNLTERSRLGGIGFMWKDVLQKNVDCGGFHVQLGLGDQIYGDRLWREVPLLKQWLAVSGKDNRKAVPWAAKHEEDVAHAYFHFYTSHFDQPYLREAFAQIPHVLQINDHEIFDGFGSYPQYMQSSEMFKNIKRISIETYLLFQHHTTIEMLRKANNDRELFTITGTGWHFVKYLGPALVVVGPDGRSERTQQQVMAGPTYQGLFPKVATLPPSVQHCIWMISVPIIYPRLEAVESLANTMTSGKKAVNTTYNLIGRATSSVAGVVGGKEIVASGFSQVKKAVGKSGLMGGVLNSFGGVDIADELRDLWTHKSKDLERTYLIRTLQGIAHQKGIRMTFLSGDVHCCGAGLVHDLAHPNDHKTMYQIISSSIVASPTPTYVLKMLHNDKSLYIPQNGHKSTHQISDTKEDMMEIFHADTNGGPREMKRLMDRRNYVAFVAYDPQEIPGIDTGRTYTGSTYAESHSGSIRSEPNRLSKLNLAVDFVVQGDGSFSAPTKYGPVIIPSLEFGR
ncbi:hypothetical protein BDZ45DRAFT_800978 [Acephala macrosclerotiorum]|nr:hypothetical protein BDZ45DRAFT_800978 [Acephala macrosclerotiorum]